MENINSEHNNRTSCITKRKCALFFIDIACFLCVYILFIVLSKFSWSGGNDESIYILNAGVFLILIMLSRLLFSVYNNIWRYANTKVFLTMMFADIVGGVAALLLTRIVSAKIDIYIGIWQSIMLVALFDVLTLALRFLYQMRYQRLNVNVNEINKIGVAIVGAGQIGALLADELVYSHNSRYKPICFIDKDNTKVGSLMCGLKVYKSGDEALNIIKNLPVQEIFIALPKLSSEEAREMYSFYSKTGCTVKIYDTPVREAEQPGAKRTLREIKIEDLLFRDSLVINDDEAKDYYSGQTVLVTGGGGSIGSELCRQIAKCNPKQLIIVDIYENNAYSIQQELLYQYGDKLNLAVEIASVRDARRLDCIFETYRPDIVFHAAAHKHVPLMEHSSCEAIKNNILGTYNTANAAEKYNVKKFILISTDKAVNPTNIMGASKRMCEMVIQCRTDSKTSFAAVRFGNVLGSNGSVIPLFQRQIEHGGPVTVTDKRIIRYFMTIPEASQLVIQAGAMAKRGELFVLDMGKPVKIIDLAENMIRLSGFVPYKDIDIVEVGLRPGEKLYEELLMKTETLTKTDNSMIFVEKDQPLTREDIEQKLVILKHAVESVENDKQYTAVKDAMKRVVNTYHDPEEVNKKAEQAEEMKQVLETENI